jgi:hypothetical protein
VPSAVQKQTIGVHPFIPTFATPDYRPEARLPRCAPFNRGWNRQASVPGHSSGRLIGMAGYNRLDGIDVARIIKKLAQFAGHSLRVGHGTSASIAGASERSIMRQSGHRSVQMMRRYIRDGSLFRENSAGTSDYRGGRLFRESHLSSTTRRCLSLRVGRLYGN